MLYFTSLLYLIEIEPIMVNWCCVPAFINAVLNHVWYMCAIFQLS